MKNKKILLLSLASICLSITSCDLLTSGFFSESTEEKTNTQKEETKDDTKTDDTKTDDTKTDDTKTDGQKTDDTTPDDKKQTYTATFYSYDNVVYRQVSKNVGQRLTLGEVYTSHTDVPKKPRDDVNRKQYVFNRKWKVMNGSHEGEIVTIEINKSYEEEVGKVVGLDVDYDIEYMAQYIESDAEYFVSFYNDNKLITSMGVAYNKKLTSDSLSKEFQGYYEPKGIKEGKLVEFAGWSTDPNASVSQAISYDNLPVVTADISYHAIFKPVDSNSKLVLVVRNTKTPVYFDSEHDFIKNGKNFVYSNNVFTKFNSSAFSDMYEIKARMDVYLGYQNWFTSIGDEAFLVAGGINKMDLGSKITTLGTKSFSSANILEFISSGLTSIGTECFMGATLGSFPQLGKITVIPNGAFKLASFSNSEISLPSTVTTIKEEAFACLTNTVEKFNIPKATTSIDSKAFLPYDLGAQMLIANVYKIQEFSVDTNNTKFSSPNGHLVDKTSNTLVAFGRKNSNIPSSVKTINSFGISGINFNSLTIPSSVTKINDSAFYECKFDELVYGGTEAQFKSALATKTSFSGCNNPDVKFSNNTTKKLDTILSSITSS